MIVLIDNYDSFSYNLYQAIGVVDPDITVVRNDEFSVREIVDMHPSHIVISPGPGRPADAGVCVDLVRQLHTAVPILGICLGHQALYEAFGGVVSYADKLMHGKASAVNLDTSSPLFAGLPPVIQAARYHSLAAVASTLPADLDIIAWADDGEIMAVAHKRYPTFGMQFHPESILTPQGPSIISNFLGAA